MPPLERQAPVSGHELGGDPYCCSSDCAGGVGIGGTTVEMDDLAMYARLLSGEKGDLPTSAFS